MYEYFPNHYSCESRAADGGAARGELTEINQACRPLIEVARRPNVRDDPDAQQLWIAQWKGLGERIETLARMTRRRAILSALAGNICALASIYMTAERMAGHKDPQKLKIYGKLLETFRKGVTLRDASNSSTCPMATRPCPPCSIARPATARNPR